MKRYLPAIITCGSPVLLFWVSCFSIASGDIIRELPLDEPGSLGTVIERDSLVKKDGGTGSLRIKTLWPTTICLEKITGLKIEDAQLLYQAKVKSQLTEGSAYLEMWCEVDGGKYFSRGKNSEVRGTTDWQTIETPFVLQKEQVAETVTLNIVIEGTGTIWIDTVTLARKPLK